jgi:hypothetical protein
MDLSLRQMKVRYALRRALWGSAFMFVLVNGALAYSIAVQDWQSARLTFLMNLATTPIGLVYAYYETKSAWDDRDRELHPVAIGTGIIAAVLCIGYFI